MAWFTLIKDRLILKLKNQVMSKKTLIVVLALTLGLGADAQYYYKDIISNKQLMEEMARLKEQKIRSVSVKSFEDDGSPSDGFSCEKEISRNYGTVETFTRSNVTGASLFTSYFNKNGMLEKTRDSAEISVTTVLYTYDEKSRITDIRSGIRSSDDDFNNEITEQHIYRYDEKGTLQKIIRVKKHCTRFLVNLTLKNGYCCIIST